MNKIRTLMLAAVSVVCTTMVAQKSITKKTYWIDGDVGHAQTVESSIDISSLSAGVHSLTFRVKDSESLWSPTMTKYFVIPEKPTAATSIAKREYWIDGNIAARTSLGASPVDISLVEPAVGIHSLTIRVQDDNGVWSSSLTKYFIIPEKTSAATSIVEREYWIDGNIAARTSLDASPTEISLVELAVGMHSLTVRVKDDTGVWSPPLTKYFVVPSATNQEDMKIARYVYWFDDDNANAVVGTVTNANGVLDIDLGQLTDGEHTLSWSMADSRGVWSEVKTATFTFTRTAITSSMIALTKSSFEYVAEEIKPDLTVTDGEKQLVEGEDYEVSYTDNTNAGNATVTVTGKGLYKESVDAQFTITKATLTVKADNKEREFGTENPELTLSYSGWKGTDDASVLTTPPIATTEATTESAAGEYVISVSGGEATNYTFSYQNGILTITSPTGIQIVTITQPVDVYTLSGVLVKRQVTTLNGLSDGVYIIGGKKVVVKRR